MGFWTRLWHRLLFGSSPYITPSRPAASASASAAATAAAARLARLARPLGRPFTAEELATLQGEKVWPPRYHYRSREEVELALLLPWLTAAERAPLLESLRRSIGAYQPWTEGFVVGEPRQQCQQWGPLVIPSPDTMTSEGFCNLLTAEFSYGLATFRTPLELLSRPVRMLWLYRLGQRAAQAYAGLEQLLGSRARAMNHVRSVVADL